jgi:hypothetical protein
LLDAHARRRWSITGGAGTADIEVTGRVGEGISLPWHDDIGVDVEPFAWSERRGRRPVVARGGPVAALRSKSFV